MKKKIILSAWFATVIMMNAAAQNTFPQVGKVGIGTIQPGEQLEVIGDVRIDGLKISIPPGQGTANSAQLLRYVMVDNDGKLVSGPPEGLFLPIEGDVAPQPPISLIDCNTMVAAGNVWKMTTLAFDNTVYLCPSEYRLSLGKGGLAVSGSTSLRNTTITDLTVQNIRATNRVRIGSKHIATGTHSDYKLAVDGKVVMKEGVVTIDNWSDFVFDSDYKLKSLEEVDAFIKENHHLPDVPSETEVKENGVNLGEMDAVLLRKIEELTLYIIQQQKEIEELKKELNKK